MWFERRTASATHPPDQLTLRELIATQPKLLRGPLAPGERFPSGMRPSRRRAQGMDLDSIGPYVPGDDVRWMDWRATARTGRAQMKRFVAESHLARMLVVDMRPDMFFGTRDYPLAKAAALIAARFAWEALNLHEPVGLIVVASTDVAVIRPRRGRVHVLHILERLEESYQYLQARREPAPDNALAQALETATSYLRRGDEICVISDFGEQDEQLSEVAKSLSERRKLYAIIVEDAIFSQTIPNGRYPIQMTNGTVRQTATVASRDSAEQVQIAEAMRNTLQTDLIRSGWQTFTMAGADFMQRNP